MPLNMVKMLQVVRRHVQLDVEVIGKFGEQIYLNNHL
jgi:hypothetical protein